MNHWSIWDLFHDLKLFWGTDSTVFIDLQAKTINYLTHFCLLPVTCFGGSPSAGGCFAFQPRGSAFLGGCGLGGSLHPLLGWLWQYDKENIEENIPFSGGSMGKAERKPQMGSCWEPRPGRCVCSSPDSRTSVILSQWFWTSVSTLWCLLLLQGVCEFSGKFLKTILNFMSLLLKKQKQKQLL